jgi:hypothetical protein
MIWNYTGEEKGFRVKILASFFEAAREVCES